jgi:hypothetical protein
MKFSSYPVGAVVGKDIGVGGLFGSSLPLEQNRINISNGQKHLRQIERLMKDKPRLKEGDWIEAG